MKRRTLLCFGLLGLLVVLGPAAQVVPVAVSPGRTGGVAVVADHCPTFSWTSVDWAVGYRIAVFDALGVVAVSYEQMASGGSTPVLTKEIEGRGLSWTPSSEEGLRMGGMYVWYVEAMSPSGPGVWSVGKVFIVDAGAIGSGTEERVTRVLREKGIREEVITDVVKEMKSGGMGVIAGEVGQKPSDTVRPMGSESGDNTFYGLDAGKNISTGLYNSFFGRGAGYWSTTANSNTFIGYNAGPNNITGYDNTFLGREAGYSNTTGSKNVFLGREAGYSNTLGADNIFLGFQAGRLHIDGYDNVFIGQGSGYHNIHGHQNTFLGYWAGINNSGSGNVFLGIYAGMDENGSNKLYIDNSETSSPLIYGEFDNKILAVNGKFAVGTKTPTYPMELKTSGRNATFVLQRDDGGAINFVNATPLYGQFGTGNNYPVRILVNQAYKMQLNTDGSLQLANGAGCTAGGHWYDSGFSSRELKENIEELGVAESQAALEQLVPVKYSYKVEKGERHVGFIAEDVPELVAMKDRKAVGAMDVVGVLTKVVQEQDKKSKEQQKAILEQQKTLSEYQKILGEQQKTIAELKDRMVELERKGKNQK